MTPAGRELPGTDGDDGRAPDAFGSDAVVVWRTAITIISIVALVAGIIAVRDDGDGGQAVTGSGESAAASSDGGGSSSVSATLSEYAIELSAISVPAGTVTFTATNAGATQHNLAVKGTDASTPDLLGGEEGTLAVDLEPGTYEIICTIAGHEASGMRETLTVTASAGGGGEVATHDTAHTAGTAAETDWAAIDAAMIESVAAFPAETEGMGNELLVPEVLADGTLRFELVAEITPWEVAPGEIVEAWTYNGMVPAPLFDVQVGDRVQIHLTNNLPINTDIHFHGIRVPNDQDGVAPITQDPVPPGGEHTYEFTLEEPAVGMYHPHNHGHHSVINGMLGGFLVGDVPLPAPFVPAGTTIAQEIPMVLNDAGVVGLTLNGKSFPATEPYVVGSGEWIMIHYMNEGLQAHPMHLHGFPQLVIARDGIPLASPYYADTLNVAPGERYTVVVNPDLAGTWVWHCHILTHAESDEGLFGMVTALIVQ
jgi:hypothetical protein